MVSPLSMPRPTYMAAHRPAGPAPTMITSYLSFTLCVIRRPFSVSAAELQSRGIALTRQRALECLAEIHRLELDVRSLLARELVERGVPEDQDPMLVASLLVQQCGRALDQALPHARRVLIASAKNRTPDGSQRLVREPVFAGVEQVAGSREGRSTLGGGHRPLASSTDFYRPQ